MPSMDFTMNQRTKEKHRKKYPGLSYRRLKLLANL